MYTHVLINVVIAFSHSSYILSAIICRYFIHETTTTTPKKKRVIAAAIANKAANQTSNSNNNHSNITLYRVLCKRFYFRLRCIRVNTYVVALCACVFVYVFGNNSTEDKNLVHCK